MEQLKTLTAAFSTLSQRERRMVTAAGFAVMAFALFMVVFTFSNKANTIRSRTTAKVKALEELQDLAGTFREAKAAQEVMERQLQGNNVRLLTYLEDKGTRAGLEIPSINPKADVTLDGDKIVESSAEFTLTDVKLNRLVDFLTLVEQGPGVVKVKYLRVEPKVATETLTAWVTVATYRLKN